MFFMLVAAVSSAGTVDVAEILGLGSFPFLDWWNADLEGEQIRRAFRTWWDKEEKTFSYDQVKRPGKLVRASGVMRMMKITDNLAAPELDGVFWLEEGGRDYSGSIWLHTKQC